MVFSSESNPFLLVFHTFAWVLLLKVDCGPSSVSTSVDLCQIYVEKCCEKLWEKVLS
jgi:hypothetical protein